MRADIPSDSRLPLILYRHLFALRTDLDAQPRLLAHELLPRHQALETLGALSALHYDDLPEIGSLAQRRRLEMIGVVDSALRQEVERLIDSGGVLIHERGLGIMIRLVMLHSVDGPPSDAFGDDLLRLALMVNELFGAQEGLVGPDTTDDELVDVELLSGIIPAVDTTSVSTRPFAFLQWADSNKSSDNWIDVRADFQRLLGIDADDYLVFMIFFVLYLTSSTDRTSRSISAVIPIGAIERALPLASNLREWVDRFIPSIEDIRGELDAVDGDYSSRSLAPFLRHSLVRADAESVVCPVPAALDNGLAAGFYFTLHDAYDAHSESKNKMRFSAMYGRFMEDHVGKLLQRIVDPETDSIIREQPYGTPDGERLTSDFLVADSSRRLVVVEVVKTRLNFVTTLIDGDRESLRGDVARIVVANLKQAVRTLNDLRDRHFEIARPFDELGTVTVLIIGGQRFPGLYGVREIVESVTRETPGLENAPAFHVMDVDELEILAAEYDRSVPLGDVMEQKMRRKDRYGRYCRLQSTLAERTDVRRSPDRIQPEEFSDFFDGLVMPTLRRWGLSDSA